jgi:hypothetical protein
MPLITKLRKPSYRMIEDLTYWKVANLVAVES